MRFVPTSIHGVADYVVGLVLCALPWMITNQPVGPMLWLPVILGGGAIAYSLFTDYEWGIRRVIPMTTHLGLDFASGVLLATSPWLFGFAEVSWAPFLLVGLFEIGAALTTRTVPGFSPTTGHPAWR